MARVIGIGAAAAAGFLAAAASAQPQLAASVETPIVPVCGQAEVRVDLQAAYQNRFDPAEIAVDAEAIAPSGKPLLMPGYFDGRRWLVRFCPLERGVHRVKVAARDRNGTAKAPEVTLEATEPKSPGFVRVHRQDPRFFAFESGRAFFPIGLNLSLADAAAAEALLAPFAQAGGNLVRIPLNPPGTPFSLNSLDSGIAKIDLAAAERLERLLAAAAAKGVRAILVLESHATLSHGWPNIPHHRDRGGPLDTLSGYWTNPQMARLEQNRFRYLIARFGAFAEVMAWELWDEPERARGYRPEGAAEWHRRNAAFLRATDPYNRLITTSSASPLGDRELERATGASFLTTHLVEVPDFAPQVSLMQARKVSAGVPHLVTAVAADRESDRRQDDPKGFQFHDAIWSSIASGAAGTALPSWPEAVRDKRLFGHFQAASRFIRGVDWARQRFRQTRPTFAFASRPAGPRWRDLVLSGPVSMGYTEYNLPRRVRIGPTGVQWGQPAGILHGRRNRPSLQNPVTFIVDLPRATRLDVEVGDVSGAGGAHIQVFMNGRKVAERAFPDPDDREAIPDRTEYRGQIVWTAIPPGRQEVKVVNVGNDWAKVAYRFRDLLPRKDPGLSGWTLIGDTQVLGFVRPTDRTWRRVIELRRPVPPSDPARMALTGLARGTWRAELWDTWQGKPFQTLAIKVGVDGSAVVPLPRLERDVAIKMTRSG